jgi:hypothetical protein
MIRAKWNENKKCTVCEITGNRKSIINEFGTIIDSLVKEHIVDVDIVLSILAKVIKENNLDDQVIDSHKKSINDLIKTLLK